MRVECFIPGVPVAKGSKRAFAGKGGKAWCVETNAAKQRPWVSAIRDAVLPLFTDGPTRAAVVVNLDFYFARPKAHLGKHGVKASAPLFHAQKPDVDKLARCVLDALTGIVYVDDAQVRRLSIGRYWSSDEHLSVGMALDIAAEEEGA